MRFLNSVWSGFRAGPSANYISYVDQKGDIHARWGTLPAENMTLKYNGSGYIANDYEF